MCTNMERRGTHDGSLLVPEKDYDVLENRLRVGLRMPTTLTPELEDNIIGG